MVSRAIWSACLGSTPSRITSSTVSSNFANLTFCRVLTASFRSYGWASTAFRALSMFLPVLRAICLSPADRIMCVLDTSSECYMAHYKYRPRGSLSTLCFASNSLREPSRYHFGERRQCCHLLLRFDKQFPWSIPHGPDRFESTI